MSVLIKASVIALIFACFSVILKSNRPEYVFILRIGTVAAIFFLMLDDISSFITNMLTAFSAFNIDSVHIALLLKSVGIAIITDFICDTLKDSGETSIAGVVALSAKFIILFMALPMINALIIFCLKFVE
ncbi:MAG: hypothetical protein J1F23_06750 [Oscillospiraceae bacterium]|nr:hypothetical protein [Oscillospiraceae bacterium]